MKLLIDNQLPLALAIHLRAWGVDCVHVAEIGLDRADDRVVWDRGLAEERIVVSKDEDFLILASRPGDCGRLIWVRLGNCRNAALIAAFDQARVAILQMVNTRQRIIEIR